MSLVEVALWLLCIGGVSFVVFLIAMLVGAFDNRNIDL